MRPGAWLAIVLVVALVALSLIAWVSIDFHAEYDPPPPARPHERAGPDLADAHSTDGPDHTMPEPVSHVGTGRHSIQGGVTNDGRPASARVELRGVAEDGAPAARRQALGEVPLLPPLTAALQTGSDGRFRFVGLAPGTYLLRANDGAGRRAHVTARTPHGEDHVRLELTPWVFALEGRASFSNGEPFRGDVVAASHGVSTRCLTDGGFRLTGLPAGKVVLTFHLPGRNRVWREFILPTDGDVAVTVDEGFRPVEGRVRSAANDEAVAGAEVTLTHRHGSMYVQTDPAGHFAAAVPGPRGYCEVLAEGFEPFRGTWTHGEANSYRLTRRGGVTGRLTADGSGEPVAGVVVFARDPGTAWIEGVREAVSDEGGRFSLPGLGPGEVEIWALGAGWVDKRLPFRRARGVNPNFHEVPPGISTDIEMPLIPAGRLEGRAADGSGKPVAGVRVSVEVVNFRRLFRHGEVSITGEDGSFVIHTLVPGFAYRVYAVPPGGVPMDLGMVTAASGETVSRHVLVELPRWVLLDVLEEGTGRPVVMAGVTVRQGGGTAHFNTGESGKVRIGPLNSEDASIRIDHGHYLCPSRARVVTAEDGERVTVHLQRGLFIAGRLLGPDGAAFTQGHLRVEGGHELRQNWETATHCRPGKDGSFRLGPLPAGRYEIVADSNRTIADRGRWTVSAGEEDLVLRLEPAPSRPPGPQREEWRAKGDLTVVVLGPDGRKTLGGAVRILTEGTERVGFGEGGGNGAHRLRILKPGAKVWLEVFGARAADGSPLAALLHGPIDLSIGEMELTLGRGRTIEGRVLNPDGAGFPGVRVSAIPDYGIDRRDDFPHATVHTGEGGWFRIRGLDEARYRVGIRTPDGCVRPEQIETRAGAMDVVFRLERAEEIRLRVVGPGGEVLRGVRAVAVRRSDRQPQGNARSGENGVIRVTGLMPEETYDVRVYQSNAGLGGLITEVRPGPEIVEVRMGPGLSITGRATGPASFDRMEVFAVLDHIHALADEQKDGSFVLKGLTSGVWKVNVSVISSGEVWRGSARIRAGDLHVEIPLNKH